MKIIDSTEVQQISSVTVRPYYIIYSTATEDIYIDTSLHAHAFEDINEANSYINEVPGTALSKSLIIVQREQMSCAYSRGAEIFEFKQRDKSPVGVKLDKRNNKLQFYNRDFFREFTLFAETERKSYVRNLAKTWFLVPIMIAEKLEGKLPVIHYSYAVIENNEMGLGFATLQQFNEWNVKQNNIWSPLKVTFTEILNQKEKNEIIINPLHEQIVLSKDIMNVIAHSDRK